MRITEEMLNEAAQRARACLQDRSDDERWAVLGDVLEKEAAGRREEAILSLTTDALRDQLYPDIDRKQWMRLGWNNVRAGRTPIEAFIHKLRVAKAAGSKTGRL